MKCAGQCSMAWRHKYIGSGPLVLMMKISCSW